MVYLKSVENVITLDKLIGLLFLFCLPLLSNLLLKTKRNDLTRPVMGTIFLVMSVCMSTVSQNTCMVKVSFGRLNPTGDTGVIHFDYTLEQLYHGLKRNVHLEMRNLKQTELKRLRNRRPRETAPGHSQKI